MGSLFPEIDEEATIEKVMAFFKVTFPRMVRMSGRAIDDLQSPAITDMPKAQSVDNKVESRIAARLEAEQGVIRTIQALNGCDMISREIIHKLYITSRPKYDYQVRDQIGYEKTRFQFYKNRALLFFADAYLLDDLHTYKQS